MLQDLRLETGPADLVVTLAEAKAHLRIDSSAFDAPIAAHLATAIAELDGYGGILGRCLAPQSWILSLGCWPGRRIALSLPPLISVEEIAYVDINGDDQVVDAGLYTVLDGPLAAIALKPTASWPSVQSSNSRAITISFTAGYAGPDDAVIVPDPIKSAIKLRVEALWRPDADVEAAITRLLRPFRVPRT